MDTINKDLLYSTGNSTGWYVAAWMGGGLGTMDTYTCTAESLHCSPETVTRLLIGYTPIEIKSLKFEKKSFLMWTILKVFIEFITILLLFYVFFD